MSNRTRVLLITNGYPNRYKPYAGMYLKRHVMLHQEAGFEIKILAPGDSRRGAPVVLRKYTRLGLRVLWALLFDRFDLVHAHWPFPAGLLATVVARVRHRPLVVTSHGAYVSDYRRRHPLIRMAVRFVLRSADRIIAVGAEHKRMVEEVSRVSPERVVRIEMGVWLGEKPSEGATTPEARLVTNDRPLIAFVGNLYRRKGADILVRAIARLNGAGYDCTAVIGGEGPELEGLRTLICDLQLCAQVTLLGGLRTEQVSDWLSAADVCVVPSRDEPFGIVAFEAMACGTPVVASDVGGLRENIRHGEDGLLFPAGDDEALAKCLMDLLSNEDLAEHLARAGRRKALDHDMRAKAASVAEIYRELTKASMC